MANSKQAIKRARQAETHRQRNASQRTQMRTKIKNCLLAIREGSKERAIEAFKVAVSYADRMAGRGIIHQNKTARLKSRLNKKIKALS